jgi:AraC family transcriptional regulator
MTIPRPVLERVLLADAGTLARLSYYPAGMRQGAHTHERAHVSIIVAGSIREVSAGRDEIGSAAQLNLRPYESTHEVVFGPQGALILAVDIDDAVARATTSGWIHRKLTAAERALVSRMLGDRREADFDVEAIIHDLMAGIETESFRGSPPRWLSQARVRLMEDPANTRIDALARNASVHRAHFARAFQHWFRTSPSTFRRRAMLSRAIAAAASGQCLAAAAQAAGFADQSHLCRAMRSLIGTTPSRLLRRM